VISGPHYLIDTNILVRFLRDDHAAFSSASRKLFEKARSGKLTLLIPFISIVETLHVLRSQYRVDQALSAREMIKILNAPGVELSAPGWIGEALGDYMKKGMSFGDACIAAEARANNYTVASFDGDFDAMAGVKRHEPK